MAPPHLHYVEPFFGGGAFLFARDPLDTRLWLTPDQGGVSEMINDVDYDLMNFWNVLRGEDTFKKFRRKVEAIPMSRAEWNAAGLQRGNSRNDPIDRAVAFFVHCRQSRSGMMESYTSPTRTRLRRGMNGNVSEWIGSVEGLPDAHARLMRVFVENTDGISLIERETTENTFFFIDPPWLGAKTKNGYKYMMKEEDHARMLRILAGPTFPAKAMVLGYDSELYRARLPGWRKVEIKTPNQMAGGDTDMVVCVWVNYPLPKEGACNSARPAFQAGVVAGY